MAVYQFHKEQKIPASKEEVWNFIASPQNLSRITPGNMGFKITTQYLKKRMYPGQIITYKVKPMLGMSMTWVTEITHVKEGVYFVDEQRQGPYKMWHHEHWIHVLEDGILMEDLITYAPPMGWLGRIADGLVIKNKLNQIFEYRRKALIQIFGEYKNKTS